MSTPSGRTRVVLVGDGPAQYTGLSRIIGQLAGLLTDRHDVDLLHVGQVDWALPPTGLPIYSTKVPWKLWLYPDRTGAREQVVPLAIAETWGAEALEAGGVVWAVQDPSRSYDLLTKKLGLRWKRWGYFPMDGVNINGTIGGPAAQVVRQFDRVLAYGPYGTRVLEAIRERAVPYIPHGIDLVRWRRRDPEPMAAALDLINPAHVEDAKILGCVTTNVLRKDLPLYFGTLRTLINQDDTWRGWLHVNDEIGEWSIPQLAADFGLDWRQLVVTTVGVPDPILAQMYMRCTMTICVGRGEGFGYPILESLAAGVPCVHVDYAGGADLLPQPWRLSAYANPPVGLYGICRPLVEWRHAAEIIHGFVNSTHADTRRAQAEMCAARYDWPTIIAPQFQAWVDVGLETLERH